MSLADTVAGSLVGVVGGFLLGLYAQNWNMKRSRNESTKERVYSPLFDEIFNVLLLIRKNEDPPKTSWFKVNETDHLGYLIQPQKLYEKLNEYYDGTLYELGRSVIASRKEYEERVKEDLNSKVAPPNIQPGQFDAFILEASRGIGWSIYKGEVWVGDIPRNEQVFDNLKSRSGNRLTGTFVEYFNFWKEKLKDDPIMLDYEKAKSLAIQQGTALRRELAKKLGVKL